MSRRPLLVWLLTWLWVQAAAGAGPEWIVAPEAPGPDLPGVGQSRFDELFRRDDGSYAVPYPVEALVEYLEARLDNDGQAAVRQVFIPLGRSLQRDAPAPDYFRYPRHVLATVGEPVGEGEDPGQVMAYRLFIAHQPKTASLEIVSYNDAAGRFEFQVVDGYRDGGPQRARPVSRAMCLSCHHNGAPIFARNPWSETSFNVEIARRLAAAQPHKYRSMIELLSLDAGVVDVLAERANYLSAAQLIWRRGCASASCRSALLRAVLQYRLSGESNFARNTAVYREDYVAELDRNWRRQWPNGLGLPASRIPDRDPFAPGTPADDTDPLMPHPPQATWQSADTVLADGIVTRLGGFFTRRDIRRLDARLLEMDLDNQAPRRVYRAACRPAWQAAGLAGFDCGGDRGELRAAIEIETRAGRATALGVVSLTLPGDPHLLQFETRELARLPDRVQATPGAGPDGLAIRLADGNRVALVAFYPDDAGFRDGGRFEVAVAEDFRFVDAALAQMSAGEAPENGGPLAGGVFERRSILQALSRTLDLAPLKWRDWPAPQLPAAPLAARRDLSGGLALLETYCARCHAQPGPHPPGFLAGPRVLTNIAACAPRMLARLQAWQTGDTPQPAPAPMPPPVSIALSGFSAGEWPRSEPYRILVASLENLLAGQFGETAALAWRESSYAELPPCRVAFNE